MEERRLMDFDFDFSYLKNGAPVVTLSSLGIAFNKGAIDMLGAPEQVIIGYDEMRKAIGVRKKEENTIAPYYEFAPRMKNDWLRIGARDFMRHLSRISKIDFITKSKQFIPVFDRDTQTLIVIVDEEHLKK